jgi:hypothetical protein
MRFGDPRGRYRPGAAAPKDIQKLVVLLQRAVIHVHRDVSGWGRRLVVRQPTGWWRER